MLQHINLDAPHYIVSFPPYCNPPPFRYTFLPHHPILEGYQPMFLPSSKRSNFTSLQNSGQICIIKCCNPIKGTHCYYIVVLNNTMTNVNLH